MSQPSKTAIDPPATTGSYTKWEYLLPALAVASLIVSCMLISAKKYFWNDELYSYYFTSEPSLWKMLLAFHDKINNTPVLYFLLGWAWDKVFSSSELSLRLFSSLGMCLALVLVWATLRKTFSFWPTSIGTLGVFCTSQIILIQNAEARMYGLFLALAALALLLYDQLYRKINPTGKLLVANTCLHAAMIHTHLFGGFYSGAVLLALLLTDRCFRLWRPKVYASVVLSWLSVLLYLPSFLNQSDAGRPRTWIPTPVFKDLFSFFTNSYLYKPSVLLVLIFISAFQLILFKLMSGPDQVSNLPVQRHKQEKAETALLIFAASFILVPVLVWIISVTIKPMFWDRYMLPSAIGFSILLTYITSRFVAEPAAYLNGSYSATVRKILGFSTYFILLSAVGFLIIYPVFNTKSQYIEPLPGSFDTFYGYADLPVVVQGSDAFVKRLHYSAKQERYYYILDWPAAVSNKSGLFGPQEYKHLQALKRNYPALFQNVIPSKDFLDKYDKFLVLDYFDYDRDCPIQPKGTGTPWINLHCPQWVEKRLLNNSTYEVSCLGSIPPYFTILLVSKDETK